MSDAFWELFFQVETVIVALSWFCIIAWLFKPNSKSVYKKYSMIPFDGDREN